MIINNQGWHGIFEISMTHVYYSGGMQFHAILDQFETIIAIFWGEIYSGEAKKFIR